MELHIIWTTVVYSPVCTNDRFVLFTFRCFDFDSSLSGANIKATSSATALHRDGPVDTGVRDAHAVEAAAVVCRCTG